VEGSVRSAAVIRFAIHQDQQRSPLPHGTCLAHIAMPVCAAGPASHRIAQMALLSLRLQTQNWCQAMCLNPARTRRRLRRLFEDWNNLGVRTETAPCSGVRFQTACMTTICATSLSLCTVCTDFRFGMWTGPRGQCRRRTRDAGGAGGGRLAVAGPWRRRPAGLAANSDSCTTHAAMSSASNVQTECYGMLKACHPIFCCAHLTVPRALGATVKCSVCGSVGTAWWRRITARIHFSTCRKQSHEVIASCAQGPLGTWVEIETASAMLQHLLLGCAQQLYAPREFCSLYWCALAP